MRVVVLTSSRADFGIYLPLLKRMQKDEFFDLKIFAFGTHLSRFHGYTLDQIVSGGFTIAERIESLILGDSPEAISNAMGNTIIKFSSIWAKHQNEIDLVIALGDRYEMFAAVAASVPFNLPIAHLHGGETTLGAIDNQFRHSITQMSSMHFVAAGAFAQKVKELKGADEKVFNVGALSLDNILDLDMLSLEAFKEKFQIDLSIPTILTTFHPETVSLSENETFADTLVEVFGKLAQKYQVVITMPNADTMGNVIRSKFEVLAKANDKVIAVENFGSLGYFSCMKHCSFLLGNTSSGIIEAASMQKYVINLGDRQKGRARSENLIDVAINEKGIFKAVNEIEEKGMAFKGENVYRSKGVTSDHIIHVLKQEYGQ